MQKLCEEKFEKMVFAQTRLKVAEAQYTSADIIYTGQWTHGGAVEVCKYSIKISFYIFLIC